MSKRYTVREYGVIGEPSPIGPILAELKRRVGLWNALVEIDHDIRERLYKATSDEALVARIATLRLAREKLWEEAKAERQQRKAKRVSDDFRRRLKTTREEIAALCAQAKEHRKAERERQKEMLAALEAERRERVKAARQASGLYWGNYLQVVEDYETARVRAAKDRVMLRPHGIRATGAITACKTSNPPAVATMLGGDNTWVQIDAAPGETTKRTRARIRIGSDDERSPIWAEATINLHRPVPDGFVRQASFVRRFIGTKPKWTFCVTVELAAEGQPSAERGGCAVIEAAPKLALPAPGEPLLVARCGELECWLPAEYFGALRKSQELVALVGEKFAASRENLGIEEEDPRAASPHRLYGWCRSTPLADKILGEIAREYRRDYEHLWNWAINGRDQALRRRREIYRVFAARALAAAAQYEFVLAGTTVAPREVGLSELRSSLASYAQRELAAEVARGGEKRGGPARENSVALANQPASDGSQNTNVVAVAVVAQDL